MSKANKENQPTQEQTQAKLIVQMKEQYQSNVNEDDLEKDDLLRLKIIEMLFTQYHLVLPPIKEILENAKMIENYIKGK